MFLSPYYKKVWEDFCPKIWRDWNANSMLIRTKIKTKKWDSRTVKNALGHNYEKTTESYIKYAEEYYRNDPYDWLRSVLKFHANRKQIKSLMKQHYRLYQKISKILTNSKNRSPEIKASPVENDGPCGLRT